ncbi:MAG: transposase [Sulfurimonas sp.]|nr:transposase [Sulfurimonas sp.]
MKWSIECLYCGNSLYRLADKRVKCSVCNKKLSMEKLNRIMTLIYAFVHNESANELAKRSSYSYVSVQKYYKEFRILIGTICEREYELCRAGACEYEEYFYLEKAKRSKKNAIYDAHNFLTFDYSNHIYTLLMPSLHKYKEQFIEDSLEDVYLSEFNKFKRDSRIIKISSHHNNIVKFWEYFEAQIVHYKGVSRKSFIYYLKEYEFKYNHTKSEAMDLLIQNYFKL